MSRDMVWQGLYDRMEKDCCPICLLLSDRTESGMDAFLYEGVTDSFARQKLSDANGFCSFHAYRLLEMGDPLAHAVLYADLIKKGIAHIGAPKRKLAYQAHEGCPFCEQERQGERIYIDAFTDAFADSAFKDKYRESGMLCLPHLELIKAAKKPRAGAIVDETLKKYRALVHDLDEIRRKNDYRFTHELWTQREKEAWKAAVEVINGGKGVRK